jgi:hypothetical protein
MKSARKREATKARADNPGPALKRAQSIARALAIGMAVFALPMSSVYFREPFWFGIGVLLAMPWVALILVRAFPNLFGIDDIGRSKDRADLAILMLIPGLGLICHAYVTVNPFHWGLVVAYGVVGGVAMTGAAALASPAVRKSLNARVGYLVTMSFYGGALAVFGTIWFDSAAPQIFTRPVLEKRFNSIGKYTAVHYVKVGSWGPYTEPAEVEVTRNFDETHKVGEPVCIYLHPGALGLSWYTAGDCTNGR